jgi:hypothetical protein
MTDVKNLGFDLREIVHTFNLRHNEDCSHLMEWISAEYELNEVENTILTDLHEYIEKNGEYMNEEELKAKMVGLVFYVAKIEVPRKVMVFYERPLSGTIQDIPLSVICDCIVATPLVSAPQYPYFFLQEFKKSKGEKKDPEAQMLIAMLIAQEKNKDEKPIYGAYLIGTGWHFATLIADEYCVSNRIEVTKKDDLLKVVYSLRALKTLILNR